MAALGMPTPMFFVFVATLLAGSLGFLHFMTVHVILGKPVAETIRGEVTEGGTTDGD